MYKDTLEGGGSRGLGTLSRKLMIVWREIILSFHSSCNYKFSGFLKNSMRRKLLINDGFADRLYARVVDLVVKCV